MIKTIIISLLLLFTVNAQNIWYVDRDATGSANGTSWANAWTSISSSNQVSGGVNYGALSAGDTIYVSGGTDSTLYATRTGGYAERIYPSGSGITYASGNPVVIAPAWQSGHNGDVYFGARDNDTQWLLAIHNISNIKLTGFNFIDNRTANHGTILYLGGQGADGLGIQDSLITIENCHIVGNGIAGMVYLEGYKITIKDCLIEQPENDLINDQDPFGLSGGRGGHTIDGCTIIMRNGNEETEAHRDGIQISNIGDGIHTNRTEITISNNLIIDTNPNGTSWNNMIYNYGWDYTPSIKFLIYNNIIVTQKKHTPLGGIAIGRLDHNYLNSVLLLNNTIIMKNNGSGNVLITWSIDSLISKNNLFIVDTTIGVFYNCDDAGNWASTYKDINYNYYAEYGGLSGNIGTAGDNYSWSQWQSAGHDANSTTGNSTSVIFSNKYDTSATGYYTETGRDLGVDLSATYPFLQYDILGNPRSGTWDMGSLEWQGDVTDTIPTYTFTATTNVELNSYNIRSAVFANADSIFTVWTETADSFKVGALSSYDIIEVEAEAGDTVFITNIASGLYETETLSYIRAGGNTQSYSVTTKSEPVVPVTGNKILKGNNGLIMKDRNGKIIRTLQ